MEDEERRLREQLDKSSREVEHLKTAASDKKKGTKQNDDYTIQALRKNKILKD